MSAPPRDRPIGVFDSGVGGLTVLRAIRSALPNESAVYLGDTARVPYGTKSPASVVRYSLQASDRLKDRMMFQSGNNDMIPLFFHGPCRAEYGMVIPFGRPAVKNDLIAGGPDLPCQTLP